jgi:hypothetical protein
MGIHADQRRAPKLGRDLPATTIRDILRRAGIGPTPRRDGPGLDGVPARPGDNRCGLRFVHRLHAVGKCCVCLVLHRVIDPSGASGRLHRQP